MVFFLYLLYPLSLLYQVIFYFLQKRKKSSSLPVDLCISIGNLSVGGTGKTPFTIHLTKLLHSLNSSIAITILSRGYGSELSKIGAKVELDSNAELVGDEPFMIKNIIPYAEILIGRNRIASFNKYSSMIKPLKESKSENKILILDDGFQHIVINRNIDIVLVDSKSPLEGGFTLPIGKLRETESSLKRADVLVFTRCRYQNKELIYNRKWEASIRQKFPQLKIFHAIESKIGYLRKQNWLDQSNCDSDKIYGKNFLKDKKVIAFCGLGSPSAFFESIEEESPSQLKRIQFKDHYTYPEKILNQLFEEMKEYDLLVCTEKDFVKIVARLDSSMVDRIFFLRIETEIWENEIWVKYWNSVLDSKIVK